MAIGPAAELSSVVAQRRGDAGAVALEGGQDIGVHEMDGGDRHLVGELRW
jgi:hypothetical protein